MQYQLLFATDHHYFPYLFVACQSILDHIIPLQTAPNSAKDQLIFNVVTDSEVVLNDAQHLVDEFSKRNTNAHVEFCFKFHRLDSTCFDNFPPMFRDNWQTFSTYYRLLVDKFLDSSVERVLYLDIDIFVQGDIRDLFAQYPLENKLLGAVYDVGVAQLSHIDNITGQDVFLAATSKTDPTKTICLPIKDYFNAGILLINVSEWRKQHISDKSLQLGIQWNWTYHDQDILNYLCSNQVEYLDWSWNFTAPLFYLTYNPESGVYDKFSTICKDKFLTFNAPTATEFYKIKQNIKIVHFTNIKPWQAFSKGVSIHGQIVNISKDLVNCLYQWYQTANKLDFLLLAEKMQNIDSITFASAYINTELKKRIDKLFRRYRLYRKIIGGALLFLFVLNIFTLSLILFD